MITTLVDFYVLGIGLDFRYFFNDKTFFWNGSSGSKSGSMYEEQTGGELWRDIADCLINRYNIWYQGGQHIYMLTERHVKLSQNLPVSMIKDMPCNRRYPKSTFDAQNNKRKGKNQPLVRLRKKMK